MNSIFSYFILLLIFPCLIAIFQESNGIDNWDWKNIGLLDHCIHHASSSVCISYHSTILSRFSTSEYINDNKVFEITNENLVKEGKNALLWRANFPKDTEYLAMLGLSDNLLAVVTKTKYILSLNVLSMETGAVITKININSQSNIEKYAIISNSISQNKKYDTSFESIIVIIGNEIFSYNLSKMFDLKLNWKTNAFVLLDVKSTMNIDNNIFAYACDIDYNNNCKNTILLSNKMDNGKEKLESNVYPLLHTNPSEITFHRYAIPNSDSIDMIASIKNHQHVQVLVLSQKQIFSDIINHGLKNIMTSTIKSINSIFIVTICGNDQSNEQFVCKVYSSTIHLSIDKYQVNKITFQEIFKSECLNYFPMNDSSQNSLFTCHTSTVSLTIYNYNSQSNDVNKFQVDMSMISGTSYHYISLFPKNHILLQLNSGSSIFGQLDSITLSFHPIWIRYEALANIKAFHIQDIPLVSLQEENVDVSSSSISLNERLESQYLHLKNIFDYHRFNDLKTIQNDKLSILVFYCELNNIGVFIGLNLMNRQVIWTLQPFDNNERYSSIKFISYHNENTNDTCNDTKFSIITIIAFDCHSLNTRVMNINVLKGLVIDNISSHLPDPIIRFMDIPENIIDLKNKEEITTKSLLLLQDSKTSHYYLYDLITQMKRPLPLQLYYHIVKKDLGTISFYSSEIEICTHYFPIQSEKIVNIIYSPNQDTLHSRSNILGDDSILLKYLNPNLVVITTISPPEAAIDFYNPSIKSFNSSEVKQYSLLTLTFIDRVSGRIIHRVVHENGASPVHSLIIENNIMISYWNVKAKRTELSSISLYEGLIDKNALNPFATSSSSAVLQQLERNANFSSFTTVPPLAMQRTYILPYHVKSMVATKTSKGITNKNILIAFGTGQVYSLDTRKIHTRRPLTTPSKSEKEEGLQQYHPLISLNHLAFVTVDQSLFLPTSNTNVLIKTTTTSLESTIVAVCVFGTDIYLNIVKPSQSFDTLSSDFNYSLLTAIISALFVGVLVLRYQVQKKQINSSWQ